MSMILLLLAVRYVSEIIMRKKFIDADSMDGLNIAKPICKKHYPLRIETHEINVLYIKGKENLT